MVKDDLQKFFKRVRKKYKCKHYSVGEYGSKTGRPHYHSVVFGVLLTQEELQEFWPLGQVMVGTSTEASIKYVAGYVSKKLGIYPGDKADRPPEFQVMSQGIGKQWAQENLVDTLLEGALVLRGRKLPIPRTYVDWMEEIFPEAVEGFRIRQQVETDLALSERILELYPEAGGKNWSELTESEKGNVLFKLREVGQTVHENLMAEQKMRGK